MRKIEPKDFNLSSRINIQENDKNEVFFIIKRKSRIIMKDGERILGYVKAIQDVLPKPINIETSAPVCSKTKAHLQNQSVLIKTPDQKTTNTT